MMYRPFFPRVYLLICEVLQLDANQLPSNTLVIKLSPSGQAFYLPSAMKNESRSSSPSVGYTSDPESEIRKAKQEQASEQSTSDHGIVPSVEIVPLSRKRRQKRIDSISNFRDTTKTAEYQELFKFVTCFFSSFKLYSKTFQTGYCSVLYIGQ
jgi:UV radiation resistance-associated gene protein